MLWMRRIICAGRTPVTYQPLEGCFAPSRISSHYNISAVMGPKRLNIQSDIPTLDCYDFASTIEAYEFAAFPHYAGGSTVYFHTYWRGGLAPFDERQEWLLKSFFATQNLTYSRLILWYKSGTLRTNTRVAHWLRRFPNNFELRVGTALEAADVLSAHNTEVDDDLVKLLVTYAFGGKWIDIHSLFIRDIAPLLEHEFITQWSCPTLGGMPIQPFSGGIMHFFKHSPYLCEMFWAMDDWGALLYRNVFHNFKAAGVQPFKVLPFCLTDEHSCGHIYPPYVPLDDGKLCSLFAVRLRNHWNESRWVERILLPRYELGLRDMD